MMANPAPDSPSHWLVYVQVNDVEAITKTAGDLGAGAVQDPTEVPGFGNLSVITDPSGALIGLWQAK